MIKMHDGKGEFTMANADTFSDNDLDLSFVSILFCNFILTLSTELHTTVRHNEFKTHMQ